MEFYKIKFSLEDFEKLISHISCYKLDEWIKFWKQEENILSIISEFYGKNLRHDWLWGVVLPILSHICNLKNNSSKRYIIGLSALPGTGKTTLGVLIQPLAKAMNISVSVVSMDDFYLPFDDMKKAIKNNPWNVSRGFPGSHSTNLIEDKISEWKETGKFNHPVFDKSLRNGKGDRVTWKTEYPEILIIEGWFLGVKSIIPNQNYVTKEKIEPLLSTEEILYRSKIQNNLKSYYKIWNLFDKIWQIKPKEFFYMNEWKTSQELEMLKIKGNALIDKNLSNFIRMLNCSIPQKSFDEIDSNFKIILDKDREIISVRLNT